jgi:hypothetical protein
LLRRAFL